MKIPANYMPAMPYLIIRDATSFLSFSKKVFAASEQMIVPAEGNKIMHGEIRIHDAVIMFAEATAVWKEKTGAIYIYVNSVDQVYKAAMENGSKNLTGPERKEYGYTAGFEDPFGTHWFIVEAEKE